MTSEYGDLLLFTLLMVLIPSDNSVHDTSSDSPTGMKESDGEMFLKSPKRAQIKKKCLLFLL